MSNVTNSKVESALAWRLCLVVMLSVLVIALPDMAYATDTPIGNIFCIVVGWFTGNTGRGIATIAITIIGIGALLGKVSWGMALIVGLGVAIVFGAGGILTAIGSGAGVSSSCSTTASFS
ncbi:MAG: TrbC/VirB2 family protein [Alphaproteobacteria bacterium]|nr:TrbC/VirB2 family protein [Alphaproteobacteria bacterium]